MPKLYQKIILINCEQLILFLGQRMANIDYRRRWSMFAPVDDNNNNNIDIDIIWA